MNYTLTMKLHEDMPKNEIKHKLWIQMTHLLIDKFSEDGITLTEDFKNNKRNKIVLEIVEVNKTPSGYRSGIEHTLSIDCDIVEVSGIDKIEFPSQSIPQYKHEYTRWERFKQFMKGE